jgi:hypothetical protein
MQKRMKTTNRLYAAFAAYSLAFASCKRAEPIGPTVDFYGVKVDWPRLDEVTNAGPDALASVYMIKRSFRYEMFPQAMVELDRLSSNPNLNEPQKKIVSDLIDQTKQVIIKAPPQAGQ